MLYSLQLSACMTKINHPITLNKPQKTMTNQAQQTADQKNAPQHHLLFDLCGVLVVEKSDGSFDLHEQGFALLKQCYAQKNEHGARRHQFFVLSNISSRYPQLLAHYPELFALFDGIFVPATAPYKKPDPRSYEQVINTHALDLRHCIMIDDTPRNVQAAQEVGMRGILFENAEQVAEKLQEWGILTT